MTFEIFDIKGRVYLSEKSDAFRAKLVDVANRLEINPDFLSAVIAFESGFDPQAVNPKSKAAGLIQWVPKYAPGDVLKADEMQQLEWVYDWFADCIKRHGKLTTLADVYMCVLAPAFVGKDQSAAIYKAPSQAYVQNSVLDQNKDGSITKWEAAEFPRRKLKQAAKRPKITISRTLKTSEIPPELLTAVIAGGIFGALFKKFL